VEPEPLPSLEKTLRYEFRDKTLLEEALRHSSFVNEQTKSGMKDNERLEFLGDAVINLVVGHMLMHQYPDVREGELSRIRALLVNEARLAEVARQIRLGCYLKLGKGESQSEGRNKPSILANSLEALVAAVYLDGGFDEAFRIVQSTFSEQLIGNHRAMVNPDYKSQLQELVQTQPMRLPVYSVISEHGPDHDKVFRVRLELGDIHTEGEGKNKKAAEQAAAGRALEILKKPR